MEDTFLSYLDHSDSGWLMTPTVAQTVFSIEDDENFYSSPVSAPEPLFCSAVYSCDRLSESSVDGFPESRKCSPARSSSFSSCGGGNDQFDDRFDWLSEKVDVPSLLNQFASESSELSSVDHVLYNDGQRLGMSNEVQRKEDILEEIVRECLELEEANAGRYSVEDPSQLQVISPLGSPEGVESNEIWQTPPHHIPLIAIPLDASVPLSSGTVIQVVTVSDGGIATLPLQASPTYTPTSVYLAVNHQAVYESDADMESEFNSDDENAKSDAELQLAQPKTHGSKLQKIKNGGISRKDRKMQQNREAALRYRQKKKTEKSALLEIVAAEESRNSDLKGKVADLEKEIGYMQSLLRELQMMRKTNAQ